MHDETDNKIKLQSSFACDRFEYVNSYNLRHFKTGKCVSATLSNRNLVLSSDCTSSNSVFKQNANSVVQYSATHCVHPKDGKVDPPIGSPLLIFDSCVDKLRTYFHYERGNNVVFISTVCPTKNFPYLSCYFIKGVFNLIKILKEICHTMLNLDLSTCFISVCALIDLL